MGFEESTFLLKHDFLFVPTALTPRFVDVLHGSLVLPCILLLCQGYMILTPLYWSHFSVVVSAASNSGVEVVSP